MYNEILRIINKKNLHETNSWASFVENNFSSEQLITLDFILESFPENLLLTEGIPNTDIITILALIAYDIGSSRELIKNLKYSKDVDYIYDRIISTTSTKYSSRDAIETPLVGDTVLEDGTLYRYSAYSWGDGVPCPDYIPTNPEEGDYWYDSSSGSVYRYSSSSWVEDPFVSRKELKTPFYGAKWLDIKTNTLYEYSSPYWEKINIPENNLKLLLPLLEDMKFFLLDTTDDFSVKENLIKNFRNLARDSFSLVKNYGTLPTLKRLIDNYLYDAKNEDVRIPFTVDDTSSPGVVSIDIPELVDYGLIDLLDLSEYSGTGPYTFQINKDSNLYKYLMKLKPAGISYNIESTGNSEVTATLIAPTVTILSVDYDADSYTLSIKNNNSFSVGLDIVDKESSSSYGPSESYPVLKANEYRVITRNADNPDFSVYETETNIKVDISYGISTESTSVSHTANAILALGEAALTATKGYDLLGNNGYVDVVVYNNNSRDVRAYISRNWGTDPVTNTIQNIAANSSISLRYYNTVYNTARDFTITAYLEDVLGKYGDSPVDTDIITSVPGVPKLIFAEGDLATAEVVKVDGGYIGITVDNPNEGIEVYAKTSVVWKTSLGSILGTANYTHTITPPTYSTYFELKNNYQLATAEVTVYLQDPDSYYANSDSDIDSVSNIDGKQLTFGSADILLNSTTIDGLVNSALNVRNSNVGFSVNAEIDYSWSVGKLEILGADPSYAGSEEITIIDYGFVDSIRYSKDYPLNLSPAYSDGDIVRVDRGYLELSLENPVPGAQMYILTDTDAAYSYGMVMDFLEQEHPTDYNNLINGDLPSLFVVRVNKSDSEYVYYKPLYSGTLYEGTSIYNRYYYYRLDKQGTDTLSSISPSFWKQKIYASGMKYTRQSLTVSVTLKASGYTDSTTRTRTNTNV